MTFSPCSSGKEGSGGVWAEMDQLRAQAREHARAKKKTAAGEWRAFARLASGSLRFRARDGDRRIKVERPCDFRPGGWRSKGFVDRDALVPAALAGVARGRKGSYARHDRNGPTGLAPDQARAVLVALDKWLEAGAKRMTRPLVIP